MHISRCTLALVAAIVLFLFIIQGLVIGLLMWLDCEYSDTNANTNEEDNVVINKPWTTTRLPHELFPLSYEVSLRPILELDRKDANEIYGSMNVTYVCKSATKYVLLHSRYINFDLKDVSLTTEGRNVRIKTLQFYNPNEFVIFQTEENCIPEKQYTLSVTKYVGQMSSDFWGMYRGQYKTKDGKTKLIVSTHMQPTGAREIFPCFDEPGFKAKFTITLWFRPIKHRLAVSNMPAKLHTTQLFDGQVWNSTTFDETPPIATYVLAFAICEYSYQETYSKSGVKIGIYAPRDQIVEGNADYATRITPLILEYYQDLFGIKYPLPKLDQIVVTELVFGAMENWGLVIYKTEILLHDQDSSIRGKLQTTNVIAHELVHMWFGNLVTPTFWNDIWLNEGFATYFSYFGTTSVQPAWTSEHLFFLENFYKAMVADETETHPIINNVEKSNDIFPIFDSITYKKGACIVRMIKAVLGEKVFMKGLRAYLKDLSYKTTTNDRLFEYWENTVNKTASPYPASISNMFTPWTTQSGFPVLNIKKQNDQYLITQERYIKDTESYKRYQWHVPLTYRSLGEKFSGDDVLTWVLPNHNLVVKKDEPILANVGATGFFKVNYDEDTWNKIIAFMKSNRFKEIPVESRGQLIGDSFSLARGGQLNITIPLKLSQYLVEEKEYLPWKIFSDNILYFDQMLFRSPVYENFTKFVDNLVTPLFQVYGLVDDYLMGDSDLFERFTIQLATRLACHFGNEKCIKRSKLLYTAWMNNSEKGSPASVNYRKDVYCTAIRNGGVKEWNFAMEQHNKSENVKEKGRLRYGMSCTKNETHLAILLGKCIQADVEFMDPVERPRCQQYIIENDYDRSLVWKYFNIGARSPPSVIDYISSTFSTKEELKLILDLEIPEGSTDKEYIGKTISHVKKNIEWRERNEQVIRHWLENVL